MLKHPQTEPNKKQEIKISVKAKKNSLCSFCLNSLLRDHFQRLRCVMSKIHLQRCLKEVSKKSEFALKYKLVWNICLIVKFIRQDQAEELLGKKKIRRGEKALLKKLNENRRI